MGEQYRQVCSLRLSCRVEWKQFPQVWQVAVVCPVRVWRWREDGGWWDELGTQEMSREDCSQHLGGGGRGREEGRKGGRGRGRERRERQQESRGKGHKGIRSKGSHIMAASCHSLVGRQGQ